MPSLPTPAVHALLADGRLVVEAEPSASPLVDPWLPLGLPDAVPAPDAAKVVVRVEDGGRPERSHPPSAPSPAPDLGGGEDLHAVPRPSPPSSMEDDTSAAWDGGAPTLRLFSVRAWIDAGAERAVLHGDAGGCTGRVELAAGRAELRAPATDAPGAGHDVFSMLTLSCALLLGRMGRTLVHAAAAADPSGGAWLLVGDARAGKTTTCVNLVRAGWRWLSDDHVVLSPDPSSPSGVSVEGWPRRFHVDVGWEAGRPTGEREPVDPEVMIPGRRLRVAPLAGLLFPHVEADAATAASPLSGAEALSRLIRQSPWLLGDRAVAPALLSLLSRAAARPAAGLRLGLDVLRDPALLATRLAAAGIPGR